MAHHAYFYAGDTEEGIAAALDFVERELDTEARNNPDVLTFRYGLFSVEDARKLRDLAELSPVAGGGKVLIISASRLFHEAQNAVLKLFEEPPEGTTLVLVLPAEGMLLPTLRSRLLSLPARGQSTNLRLAINSETAEFLKANGAMREKLIAKLLDRAKSDKDDEKQAARLAAIRLVEGLAITAHGKWLFEKTAAKRHELQLFLEDTNQFLPILHERSAPLKLVFEHLLLTLPV